MPRFVAVSAHDVHVDVRFGCTGFGGLFLFRFSDVLDDHRITNGCDTTFRTGRSVLTFTKLGPFLSVFNVFVDFDSFLDHPYFF